MKTFVTIFPDCENVHLVKDVGQIPLFMHMLHGYDARLVCYRNEPYPNLAGEANGLQLEFPERKGRRSFWEKAIIAYLKKNAEKIDVLNLYHYSKQSFLYGLIYMHYNPKGKIYLKVDAYNETFAEGADIRFSKKFFKNAVLKHLEKRFLKKVALMSIETQEGERLMKLMFPQVRDKIMRLPVGINDRFQNTVFAGKFRTFAEKENIILISGRIGEPIKNHEMILRAVKKTDMHDWKLVFVGPVNASFQEFSADFLRDNPTLKAKIIFTGRIDDRAQLYEWYNRSKVVCMTSVRESFCHALVEGLFFGNYLLGTEGIMSMRDLTYNETYGKIIPHNDHAFLASQLQSIFDGSNEIGRLYEGITAHAREHFTWSNIIPALHEKLK